MVAHNQQTRPSWVRNPGVSQSLRTGSPVLNPSGLNSIYGVCPNQFNGLTVLWVTWKLHFTHEISNRSLQSNAGVHVSKNQLSLGTWMLKWWWWCWQFWAEWPSDPRPRWPEGLKRNFPAKVTKELAGKWLFWCCWASPTSAASHAQRNLLSFIITHGWVTFSCPDLFCSLQTCFLGWENGGLMVSMYGWMYGWMDKHFNHAVLIPLSLCCYSAIFLHNWLLWWGFESFFMKAEDMWLPDRNKESKHSVFERNKK